jgi:hypothetical protein
MFTSEKIRENITTRNKTRETEMKTYDAGLLIIVLAAAIGWGVSYLGNAAVAGDPVPTYCERYVERVTETGRELICEAKEQNNG